MSVTGTDGHPEEVGAMSKKALLLMTRDTENPTVMRFDSKRKALRELRHLVLNQISDHRSGDRFVVKPIKRSGVIGYSIDVNEAYAYNILVIEG